MIKSRSLVRNIKKCVVKNKKHKNYITNYIKLLYYLCAIFMLKLQELLSLSKETLFISIYNHTNTHIISKQRPSYKLSAANNSPATKFQTYCNFLNKKANFKRKKSS